jgi:hypothetical protein
MELHYYNSDAGVFEIMVELDELYQNVFKVNQK